MSRMRPILTTLLGVGMVCIGYGMWVAMAPNEEKKREMMKNLPEANPVKMEETRKKNELIMQMIKEAAETNDNIARGTGPTKKEP